MGNAVLTQLDLQDNSIGDVGAVALAEALSKDTALTVLQLCHNSIGDTGAAALSHVLAKNNILDLCIVHGNSLGWAGALVVAKAQIKQQVTSFLVVIERIVLMMHRLTEPRHASVATNSSIYDQKLEIVFVVLTLVTTGYLGRVSWSDNNLPML